MLPCIGILDSGLGGLSVLKEIHALMPSQNLLYVADSAWCPYGPKPAEQIQKRVLTISDFLISQGAECIVVACNSATISAVEALRNTFAIPFIGMEPGVKPAVQRTKSGVVGILATEASLAGEKFHRLVDQHAEGARIITRPCPRFVELVEKGDLDSALAKAVVAEEITPLLEEGVDTFVLGCTHYPFLRTTIESQLDPSVHHIIDTGNAVARRVKEIALQIPNLKNTTTVESIKCYSTDYHDTLAEKINHLVPGLNMDVLPLDL